MRIISLRLFEFRNFASQSISLRPRLNFFLGANAQGKTNLLEAVYLLSTGQSFRPAQYEHFLRQSRDAVAIPVGPQARISAHVESPAGEQRVVVDFLNSKRSPTLDGKRTGFSTLAFQIPVVLFSPESLSSIKEGPEERRTLIDSVLQTQSERESRLIREYVKTLRARNRLLSQIAAGDVRTTTRDALESLTKVFLLVATQLTEARVTELRRLKPYWQSSVNQIMGVSTVCSEPNSASAVSSDFAYEISGQNATDWSAEEIYNALCQRQRELATRELELGASLIGPHKHDLRFLFAGNDSRFYCSQGQQRALILAFKIAQINLHHSTTDRYPVLLLDDVMSELDEAKRNRLMEYLEGINAQVLITATDLTWSRKFSRERNAVFKVDNGIVTVADSSAIRAVDLIDVQEDAKKPAQQVEV